MELPRSGFEQATCGPGLHLQSGTHTCTHATAEGKRADNGRGRRESFSAYLSVLRDGTDQTGEYLAKTDKRRPARPGRGGAARKEEKDILALKTMRASASVSMTIPTP